MTKITAIHSGGDWNDASAEYLILPPGMKIDDEKKAWQEWYIKLYMTNKDKKFVTLFGWCLQRGAQIPDDNELEIFCDGL